MSTYVSSEVSEVWSKRSESPVWTKSNGPGGPLGADAFHKPQCRRIFSITSFWGGATSEEERRHVIRLAEQNENITGFILDDFFHARPQIWLAANRPRFPVTLTVKPPAAVNCHHLELVQTDWHSGDYRGKDVAVEVSPDGQQFTLVQETQLPNEPDKSLRIALPSGPLQTIRIQIRSTHDTQGAISCGLESVRFLRNGQPMDLQAWKAEASSTYSGYSAAAVLQDGVSYSGSLSPEQLRALGERHYRDKKLPITAVVYVRQTSPQLKPYLDEVDQVSLWTWRPADLDHLSENLTAMEELIPGKRILLDCYMFDFDKREPLPVARMKMQVDLAHRWLREGRIQGIIFLATPNADVDLEAVEWTRQWIARVRNEETILCLLDEMSYQNEQ